MRISDWNSDVCSSDLIDRKALEAALRDGAPLQRNDCARIMELVDTEAWIAHWSSPSLLPACAFSAPAWPSQYLRISCHRSTSVLRVGSDGISSLSQNPNQSKFRR